MYTSGECIFFIKLVKYFYRASDLVDIEIGFIFLMSYFQQHLRRSVAASLEESFDQE